MTDGKEVVVPAVEWERGQLALGLLRRLLHNDSFVERAIEDIDGHGVCAGWLHLEGDVAEAIDDNEIAMLCSLGAVESTP